MEKSEVDSTQAASPARRRSVVSIVLRVLVAIAILAAVLFFSAGRLDWPEAWAFVTVYFAYLFAFGVWGTRKDPALMRERSRVGANVKSWDKVIMGLYSALLFAMFMIAGLDVGRFRWSSTPPGVRVAGWLGMVLAGGIVWWTMSVNTYLSRMVRIQEERKHSVVTAGPYRFVRHPMYVGVILIVVCVPAALGSWWAMAVGIAIGILFIIRTALEDRTLREELPGYQEYTGQVRYRLLPGVW